jgi:hypothetical protein
VSRLFYSFDTNFDFFANRILDEPLPASRTCRFGYYETTAYYTGV